MMATGKGLYFTHPYEAALYKQRKERERREELAERLFPTDLTPAEQRFEPDREDDWDRMRHKGLLKPFGFGLGVNSECDHVFQWVKTGSLIGVMSLGHPLRIGA
jgi:hypothetical protein